MTAFSPNRSDNTRRLGTKRPGISFEVAIRNGRGRRNRPRKPGNFERPTNSFTKNCGGQNSSLTRRSNSCDNSNRRPKHSAKGRSRCRAMCLCHIIPTAPK